MTADLSHPVSFPLREYLAELTVAAGHHIDPDTLDPTTAGLPDAVGAWVQAAARHAAATHQRDLLDGAIQFCLQILTDDRTEQHADVADRLAALLRRCQLLSAERDAAVQALTDACRRLTTDQAGPQAAQTDPDSVTPVVGAPYAAGSADVADPLGWSITVSLTDNRQIIDVRRVPGGRPDADVSGMDSCHVEMVCAGPDLAEGTAASPRGRSADGAYLPHATTCDVR